MMSSLLLFIVSLSMAVSAIPLTPSNSHVDHIPSTSLDNISSVDGKTSTTLPLSHGPKSKCEIESTASSSSFKISASTWADTSFETQWDSLKAKLNEKSECQMKPDMPSPPTMAGVLHWDWVMKGEFLDVHQKAANKVCIPVFLSRYVEDF